MVAATYDQGDAAGNAHACDGSSVGQIHGNSQVFRRNKGNGIFHRAGRDAAFPGKDGPIVYKGSQGTLRKFPADIFLVFGKLDFSNLFVALGTVPEGTPHTLEAIRKAGVPVFAYGSFITVAVNFIILAFIIFLMIKQINRLKREAPAEAPAPEVTPEDVVLLREIRDSLKR